MNHEEWCCACAKNVAITMLGEFKACMDDHRTISTTLKEFMDDSEQYRHALESIAVACEEDFHDCSQLKELIVQLVTIGLGSPY